MSFIKGRVVPPEQGNPYEPLGYKANPFPAQGEIRPDVFVPRAELDPLQRDLQGFLSGRPEGTVWALSGAQGLGKSNFLAHLDLELREMEASGEVLGTAHRLLPSIALSPSRVVEEMVAAISHERVLSLIENPPGLPEGFQSTDFERFWRGVGKPNGDVEVHAHFLTRWLSGHQTYQVERNRYGIMARERLPPAVAFPFLRGLVEMLQEADLLTRIVLLLDEFEEVQLLQRAQRTEYVQTLKALLNVFNWKGLYVIVAGAPAAFTAIAETYPSLASRWRVAELQPLQDTDEAVTLANEYKKQALIENTAERIENLAPNDLSVKEIYIRLFGAKRSVTQRELLTELHEEVERLARGPGPSRRGIAVSNRGGIGIPRRVGLPRRS